MKQLKDIAPLVVDEVAERENKGRARIGKGSECRCARCRKPLASAPAYRFRTYQSACMGAPSFTYYCVGCIALTPNRP